jgi:molybdate transport system permease protein
MTESTLQRVTPATASQATSRSRRWRSWPLWLASLPLLLLLILPLLALVLRVQIGSLLANLTVREVGQAIWLSLVTTLMTTLITLMTGTPVAYLLARRQFRGRDALDTLIDLPMVLPPSVAGIALLVAFGRRGIFGQYLSDAGLSIAFTPIAVVLAQIFVAAPFYIKAATAGFAGVDREIEAAAQIDGATPLGVFRYVTVPLTWPVLTGGAVMTWARALGEFGATIIFAGNFPGRTQTMPLAIYIGFELNLNVALTLSVILLAVSFGVLFVVKRLLKQRVHLG